MIFTPLSDAASTSGPHTEHLESDVGICGPDSGQRIRQMLHQKFNLAPNRKQTWTISEQRRSNERQVALWELWR